MTYTPKTGHVVTFVNTYDSKTRYHVDYAGAFRLRLSPIDQSADFYSVEVDLSRELAAEMGVSPAVLSDDEMATLKAVYAAMLLESMDLVESAMLAKVLFGEEVAQTILPAQTIEDLTQALDGMKAGIQFLEDARNGVLV